MLKSVDSRCDRAVEHARDRPDYPYIFRLGRTCLRHYKEYGGDDEPIDNADRAFDALF